MAEWQRPADPEAPSARWVFAQVALGVVAVPVLHVLVFGGGLAAAWLAGELGLQEASNGLVAALLVGVMALSLVQALYVGPVAVILLLVRRPLGLGVILGALITFLLQGSCYGVFLMAGVFG